MAALEYNGPGKSKSTMLIGALANPTRWAILESLRDAESTPSALAVRLEISQPAVSNQLRILRDAGLVRSRRRGQTRLYSLQIERLHEAICLLAGLSPVPHCRACPDRPFCGRESGAL
jgi:DNA-binding transcriptional ArsR family regulator